MKKIICILIVLLLTSNVFGVINIGDVSHIEYGIWSEKTHLVHFFTEYNGSKHFYMLAYEPNFIVGKYVGIERNVYLYSYNISPQNPKEIYKRQDRWIRVSDVVLTNYYRNSNIQYEYNYQDVDFFTYDKDYHNTSHSSVNVEGNTVTFILDIHKKENGSVTIKQQVIVLERASNRASDGYTYKVKK